MMQSSMAKNKTGCKEACSCSTLCFLIQFNDTGASIDTESSRDTNVKGKILMGPYAQLEFAIIIVSSITKNMNIFSVASHYPLHMDQ